MKKFLLIQIFIFIVIVHSLAQKDSLVFVDGERLVGELKSMDKNVLKMETDFSNDDFKIEWSDVRAIFTKNRFLITLSDSRRYDGKISTTEDGKLVITTQNGEITTTDFEKVVAITDLDEGFWKNVSASIDFGFNLTKANNFKQVSMRSNIGYKAINWQLEMNYNTLNSKQDNTNQIERTDGGATYRYFLSGDWYPLASLDFLSNDEQQIKLRSTAKLGIGNYIIHTNKMYWGFSAGVNYNKEVYNDISTNKNSWEGFTGTELNLFNMGDLSLLTKLVVYPGITEKGRFRSDFKIDIKYDLPLDFYIKFGLTDNFDNQPVSGSMKNDYVIQTGVGWSL
jgi:hypothetical protein